MSRFEDIKKLNTGMGCTIEDYIFIYGLITLLKPKTIVEIGTNTGASAIVMGLALKENNIDGTIYTFDISEVYRKIALKQIMKMELEGYIKSLLGNSDKVKEISLEYDFAFIDGDHTYEGVKKDFENLKDISDYILFHDTQNCDGVKRFINELRGEKLSLLGKDKGTVYDLGEFKTFANFPGFALWRKT